MYMRNVNFINKICLAAFILISGANVADGQSYLDYTSFLKNNTGISGLQFSPDGRSLMYTLTKVDWENNKRNTEFVLYDIATKTPQTLTIKERGAQQPRWSPFGRYMSFLALSDTNGGSKLQLHIKELASGKTTCITSAASGVTSYEWSPAEDRLLYIAKEAAPKKEGTEKFVQAFEVGNNSYTAISQPLSAHLYLIDTKGGSARRLTNGTWSVKDMKWMNDQAFIFTKAVSPYTGDATNTQAILYDVTSGKTEQVASSFISVTNSSPSPDKISLAIMHPKNNVPANMYDISVVGLKDEKITNLTKKLDRAILGYEWMPDGETLVLLTAHGTRTGLQLHSRDTRTTELHLQDISTVGEFAVSDHGLLALTGTTLNAAAEIYLLDPATENLEKISSYNRYLENYQLGKTESIEWPVSGGMTTDGIITYPPNFDKTKKYPLVLFIHGGPTASSFESFHPVAQYIASNGWIVFQPNYRGSLNRGNQFQSAIANDAGLGPGEDIIKGIAALKQKGNIDEKQIAVTGWSYGGYMTAWLIGQYPNMWKAAVAGAAPVDITDATSLTDNNVILRHAITSSPWKGDNLKKYMEMSPIQNLSRVRTPTLVMSVVGDERVSITGSYKIYHALKANDVPVQFIAYPGSTHFPTDPANQNDVYQRWVSWLKKYLK